MPSNQLQHPSYQLSGFSGARDTLRAMVEAAQGTYGERSPIVRQATEEAIGRLSAKAYGPEILAIGYWVTGHVSYVNDPLHVELLKTPERLVREVRERGHARGDCDDMACLSGTMALQLGRQAQFVVVGFGERGGFSHVFCRVLVPKTNNWVVIDPVAGSNVRSMLGRVKTYQIWSLDEAPNSGPLLEK